MTETTFLDADGVVRLRGALVPEQPVSHVVTIGFAQVVAAWDVGAQAGFVAIYTPSDGDRIQTVRVVSLPTAFDNSTSGAVYTEATGAFPGSGEQLGGQNWDLTQDDNASGGISYPTVVGGDMAIKDAGRFWPITITNAATTGAIGLVAVNVNDATPPTVGSITVELIVLPAA